MINRLIKPGNRKILLRISAVCFQTWNQSVPIIFAMLVFICLFCVFFECSLGFHLYIKLYCFVFRSSVPDFTIQTWASPLRGIIQSLMFLLFLLLFKYNVRLSKKKNVSRYRSLAHFSCASWKKITTTGIDPGHKAILWVLASLTISSPRSLYMASPCRLEMDSDGRGVLRSKRTSCRDVKSRSPWRQVMVQTPSPIPRRSVGFGWDFHADFSRKMGKLWRKTSNVPGLVKVNKKRAGKIHHVQ